MHRHSGPSRGGHTAKIEIANLSRAGTLRGLIWTRLLDNEADSLPRVQRMGMTRAILQVLPNSVELNAAAGRQVEGFLDVSHFAFVHIGTFGEATNPRGPGLPG